MNLTSDIHFHKIILSVILFFYGVFLSTRNFDLRCHKFMQSFNRILRRTVSRLLIMIILAIIKIFLFIIVNYWNFEFWMNTFQIQRWINDNQKSHSLVPMTESRSSPKTRWIKLKDRFAYINLFIFQFIYKLIELFNFNFNEYNRIFVNETNLWFYYLVSW